MNRILVVVVVLFVAVIGLAWWWQSNLISNSQLSNSSSAETLSTEDMFASLSGEEFDKAYLMDMLALHQGALNMASQASSKTTHPEIIELSDEIIATQTDEIRQMLEWQKQWGHIGSDPHAGHAMEGGGMAEAMAEMTAKLYDLEGSRFDEEFLRQMIAHHKQAIEMSRHAENNAYQKEIQQLAESIIDTRQSEIITMEQLLKSD
ncbi:hypothetical protein B7Y94_01240 [Candidatus Saccharibacteria bacterium 32-49-12]|nr:MAG: hypothetical protein B7Y94_01240 [Candidatus Saccharibacteria bacterium 32-49-12]